MPWWPNHHSGPRRGKKLRHMPNMLYSEKGGVRARRWKRLFLIWFPLAFVILANAATPTRSISKRGSHQEIRFEEKLETEQRLSDLGYWTGPVDGNLDPASRHALIAFQKVEGRQRTGLLTSGELDALRPAGRPRPRFTGYYHVEVDLRRQVLFIVDSDDRVSRILPISTGSGKLYSDGGQTGRAHTPRGKFRFCERSMVGGGVRWGFSIIQTISSRALQFTVVQRCLRIRQVMGVSAYRSSPLRGLVSLHQSERMLSSTTSEIHDGPTKESVLSASNGRET